MKRPGKLVQWIRFSKLLDHGKHQAVNLDHLESIGFGPLILEDLANLSMIQFKIWKAVFLIHNTNISLHPKTIKPKNESTVLFLDLYSADYSDTAIFRLLYQV